MRRIGPLQFIAWLTGLGIRRRWAMVRECLSDEVIREVLNRKART